MRKIFLASISAAALTMASGAWAQQQQQPGAGTEPLVPPAGSPEMGAGTTVTPDATTGGTTGMMGAGETGYRSYSELGDGFDGEIAGDFEAEEVKDAKIVDNEGNEIGEVKDLLVGDGDRVEHALVELSEADGQHVAIRLDELSRAEGDASDELVTSQSAEELRAMTAYEQEGERWVPKDS